MSRRAMLKHLAPNIAVLVIALCSMVAGYLSIIDRQVQWFITGAVIGFVLGQTLTQYRVERRNARETIDNLHGFVSFAEAYLAQDDLDDQERTLMQFHLDRTRQALLDLDPPKTLRVSRHRTMWGKRK